ncbi:MAG: hypothetical protein AAF770_02180 [Bacteroidota bacterium]
MVLTNSISTKQVIKTEKKEIANTSQVTTKSKVTKTIKVVEITVTSLLGILLFQHINHPTTHSRENIQPFRENQERGISPQKSDDNHLTNHAIQRNKKENQAQHSPSKCPPPLDVKAVYKRIKKKKKSIERKFPYYEPAIDRITYKGIIYEIYNVEGKGDCWVLATWILAANQLITSKISQKQLTKELSKLENKIDTILEKYQAWYAQLTQVIQELDDPTQAKYYLDAFEKAYLAYAAQNKSVALSKIQRGIAPGESSGKKITDPKMQAVWRKIKPSWSSAIVWFPRIPTVKQAGRTFSQDIYDEVTNLSTVFDQNTRSPKQDFRLKYIKNIIEDYQQFAQKIIHAYCEFQHLKPHFISALSTMPQQTTIAEHRKWLQKKPAKLALVIRFIRLVTLLDHVNPVSVFPNLHHINMIETNEWGSIPKSFIQLVGLTTENNTKATLKSHKGDTYTILKVLYKNYSFVNNILILSINNSHFCYAVPIILKGENPKKKKSLDKRVN